MNISYCLNIPLFSELLGVVLGMKEDIEILPFTPDWFLHGPTASGMPDIVILDCDTARLYPGLFEGASDIKYLLLCTNEEMKDKLKSLRQHFGKNLRGLLPHDCGLPLLEKAVRVVHAGELWLPRALWKEVLADIHNNGALTRKEKAIASLVCGGLTNKEIAIKMNLSEQTVKSHCNKIFKKLGVSNRVQLAMHCRDHSENFL
jgi:DNA-binding NarL/FixJ family response regulator